jgi:malate/lactate dehydrogenase
MSPEQARHLRERLFPESLSHAHRFMWAYAEVGGQEIEQLAHHLGNVMTHVKGELHALERGVSEDPSGATLVQFMQRGADRLRAPIAAVEAKGTTPFTTAVAQEAARMMAVIRQFEESLREQRFLDGEAEVRRDEGVYVSPPSPGPRGR